ncbi:hypothetical protein [uncultured Cellulomonas sp.]|uniref:hypothetical protein n=1 Tax=uncultured Cellulomonas sp. TaxID=189682 RepID=UPI002634EF87|nr:hypothetical protein [uncultured Cellulomonas sp.]
MTDDDRTRDDQSPPSTSPGEWVIGALGALLVAAMVSVLAHQAVTWDGPARLEVTVGEVHEAEGGYVTSVVVENTGGRTAESARITGAITHDGTLVESAATTVSYVPPDSRREAVLVFATDPVRTGVALAVGVSGYTSM